MVKTFKALSLVALAAALALTAAVGTVEAKRLPKKKTLDPDSYSAVMTTVAYDANDWWLAGWVDVAPVGASGVIKVQVTVLDVSNSYGMLYHTIYDEQSYVILPGTTPAPFRFYWEDSDDWGTPPICWSGAGWFIEVKVWVLPNAESNTEYYGYTVAYVPGPYGS